MTTDEMIEICRRWHETATPEEKAEMHRKQRESWIRAFAPCEHGDPDWETCPHCLEGFSKRQPQP